MEWTDNDNPIMRRYLDRMVPDDFGRGGSEFGEQEKNPDQAVTQIITKQTSRRKPGKPDTMTIMVSYRSTLTCGGGSIHCMDIHIH